MEKPQRGARECRYCGGEIPAGNDKYCSRTCFVAHEDEETYCPTPEEIRERAAAIRLTWTERVRKSRQVGHNPPADTQLVKLPPGMAVFASDE